MGVWKESAETLARKGWTFPMSMTPRQVVEFSEIEGLEELDKAMEEYFSADNEYNRMKRNILEHKFIEDWKELLEQCFENYEKGNHLIVIPNLFIVIEGLAHMLVSPRFEKYLASNKRNRKPPLRDQYSTVKQEVASDRVYLILYVSVMEFLNEVFKVGNFDKNSDN